MRFPYQVEFRRLGSAGTQRPCSVPKKLPIATGAASVPNRAVNTGDSQLVIPGVSLYFLESFTKGLSFYISLIKLVIVCQVYTHLPQYGYVNRVISLCTKSVRNTRPKHKSSETSEEKSEKNLSVRNQRPRVNFNLKNSAIFF
jgi:hypothetical protein